jgi:hypothetical protein
VWQEEWAKKSGGGSAAEEGHCTKLKSVRNQLMLNETLVEAAGVELSLAIWNL